MSCSPIKVTIIGGPTASGKSAFAMDYAAQHKGTLICGDSLQLYEAIPLLTAQPTLADKAAVPHELYGILAPHEAAHLGWWLAQVSQKIKQVAREGRTPIVVGGTGMYLRALEQGLADIPSIPPAHRQFIREQAAEKGTPWLYDQLSRADPAMAERLKPNDQQRLLRAYEVVTHTGKSLGHWQKNNDRTLVKDFQTQWTVLLPSKADLLNPIRQRLEKMVIQGALDQVAALLKYPQTLSPTLSKAIGFPEFSAHLKGDISLDDAMNQAAQNTASYVKRQITWFRHQSPEAATILGVDGK
ncbi:tRNA (adenosine(37)-N6)-dimethylallyltransferase MiaA [Alphaproteobacteria bacterium]|nr:tRNA (adenosine(37)-N6)-dimethylallyltransferase MiaA [Alphaproteobacteria bacterium]